MPVEGEVGHAEFHDALCEGAYGPLIKDTRSQSKVLDQMVNGLHRTLWDILKYMDEDESKKFGRFISKLSTLSYEEIDRIFLGIRVIGFLWWLIRGLRWIGLFFAGGLTAMATGGDQVVKVIGYFKALLQFYKGIS